MKRVIGIGLAVCLIAVLAGCKTQPSVSISELPANVENALNNRPENVLVGVGTAKMSTLNQSMTFAQQRARADLSQQLNNVTRVMVNDYTAGSEVDLSANIAFQESISTTLSESRLTGATTQAQGQDKQGNYYVVMYLSAASAASSINQAINQAAAAQRLEVPQLKAQDAQDRMNELLKEARSEGTL